MKKLLGALALTLAIFVAPIHAAKDETTTTVKERKTAAARRKAAEKKAEFKRKKEDAKARAKARKEARAKTKNVDKESTSAQRTKPMPRRTTTVHTTNSSDKIVGKTEEGRDIYQGPRGGHYYLTDSGNKEYVKTVFAR